MSKSTSPTVTIGISELEEMIRKVVREELARAMIREPELFQLEPGTPLYQDMEEILQRRAQGRIKLYSYDEVWSD
ncbi:MAG TPA: hypothetical protein EYP49_11970 [Anaerolineae bacterium]|nr:hypothetical protein [Anaerolineae bacterium]